MSFTVNAPAAVTGLIDRLERQGFEAWAVGGCVRDALLGLTPHDWDLCTAATPAEMRGCFAGLPVLETGLRHGTLTVRVDHVSYEVTTYRADGVYADGRRPEQVRFLRDVGGDLARRDFTVNAMAWHPQRGLLDLCGGRDDLRRRLIRAVGDPRRRFEEDALRILRALRFAAVLDFAVDADTAAAIHAQKELLRRIAAERIREEFFRLLTGPAAPRVLEEYFDVFCVFVPELAPMRGFAQHSRYHDRDVWGHVLAAFAAAPADDLTLRLAALLHDVGKPECFTLDAEGRGHFYGHEARSAQMAQVILLRLRADGETVRQVSELIARHGLPATAEKRFLRRWCARLSAPQLRRLLALKRADTMGHAAACRPARLQALDACGHMLDEIEAAGDCLSLAALAVNGRDLLALGLPAGPQVGALLRRLLDAVLDGSLANEHTALLAEAQKEIAQQRLRAAENGEPQR